MHYIALYAGHASAVLAASFKALLRISPVLGLIAIVEAKKEVSVKVVALPQCLAKIGRILAEVSNV